MSANNLWFTGPFWFFRFGVGFPRESGAKLSGLMPVLDHEMVQQNSPGACRICNGVKSGFNIQSEAGCPSRQAPGLVS
jgi:hypothetical protein